MKKFFRFLVLALIFSALFVYPVFAQGETPPVPGDPPVESPTVPADVFKTLLILAYFVERLVQPFKQLWQKQPNQQIFDLLAVHAVSILFCVALKLDIYAAAGLVATEGWAKWVFTILTAPILAGGANSLHDISTYLASLRVKGNAVLEKNTE